jgi:ATP/maltotriose-dependent transcriptional regulator MalT
LRFFNYLAPRLEELPVVLFASVRSGEPPCEDLARLIAGPETTLLHPRPLSSGATLALCREKLGVDVSSEFAAACRRATRGNPLFLVELLREIAQEEVSPSSQDAGSVEEMGAAGVAESVLLRLAGRPKETTRMVRAVAVLGDGADLQVAATLAQLSDEEAAAAADELAAAEILRRGDGLEFSHPIVRESVYAEIGPHERAEMHAQAARILLERGGPEERVAAQIAAADPAGDPERVELLRRVALESLRRGAPQAAASLLRRALVEPPPEEIRAEVLLELGATQLRMGKPEAADHLEEAMVLLHDPERIAVAARELANARAMPSDYDGSVAALRSGIELIEDRDPELALLLEAELAAKALQATSGARHEAAELLRRHAGLEGETPGERLVLASLAYQEARTSESSDQAAGLIERALAGGRLLREQHTDVAGPFYALARSLLCTDALDLARECLDQALADARERGSIPATAYVLAHRGWGSLRQGSVAAAEADLRTAMDLLNSQEIRLGTAFSLAGLLEALIERGEIDEAERALADSHFAERIPHGMVSNNLLEARAAIQLARGRPREAYEDLVEFGRADEEYGAANPLSSRWRSRAALALDSAGDRAAAQKLAGLELERARTWGASSGIGIALRAQALVEDDGRRALELLEKSATILSSSPARLEFARSLTDWGAALRRANRRAEARSRLEEGLTVAERGGARALAQRARAELRSAGGPTSDPMADGVGQLTASELRVAELAADGMSNPEIAQTLFVTRKTVETHLGRVYRKLGVAGRGELPGVLAERSGG